MSGNESIPPTPTLRELGDLHHTLGFLRSINQNLDSPNLQPGDLDPAIERLEQYLQPGEGCTSFGDGGDR